MNVVVCLHAPLGRDDTAALTAGAALAAPGGLVALVAGGREQDPALHAALAAGAARAVRLSGDGLDAADFHSLGLALAASVQRLAADLVLAGARSGDEGLGAVSGSLAEHLGAVHLARAVEVEAMEGGRVAATVRGGGFKRRLAVRLPAVISVTAPAHAVSAASAPPAVTSDAAAIELLTLEALGIPANLIRRRDALLGEAVAAPPRSAVTVGSAADLFAVLTPAR